MALTTVSQNSANPADLSSIGSSGTTTSWPLLTSSGTRRCQSQALPPPPWIRTKLAMPRSLTHGYDSHHAARFRHTR
jgi:hypothetical protein